MGRRDRETHYNWNLLSYFRSQKFRRWTTGFKITLQIRSACRGGSDVRASGCRFNTCTDGLIEACCGSDWKRFGREKGGGLTVELLALDQIKSPREKLEIVVGVHKILVDGLTFPAMEEGRTQSSSADLLLPVLIYRFPSSLSLLMPVLSKLMSIH